MMNRQLATKRRIKAMTTESEHVETTIAEQSWDKTTNKGFGSRSLSVTLSYQKYSEFDFEYIVRTTNKSILRNGNQTRVITEETVESFNSKKSGVAEYNYKLNSMSHPRYEEVRIALF